MKATVFIAAGLFALASSGVSAQSAGPNDAQIAAIVVTANQVDIDAGKLAQSKSGNTADGASGMVGTRCALQSGPSADSPGARDRERAAARA